MTYNLTGYGFINDPFEGAIFAFVLVLFAVLGLAWALGFLK